MVESSSKQVRVDNWGIFFLQRLQLFFNKTDYCDLTLQFEGNVQLKVHRLVLNACTEYFNLLEQTCEVVDDVLTMPPDLQADVVLPIINFMYTGMLEFHTSIFDKLYRTAELMNITVLTKLLDAQKQPVHVQKSVGKKNNIPPHTWNLQGKKVIGKTVSSELPATLPGRKLPVWKRKSAPVAVPHPVVSQYYTETKRTTPSDPLSTYDNTPKPTRFEWPEDDLSTFNLMDSSFDDITYTSKPLLTQEEEMRASTSFDDIKHAPNIKRSGSKNYDDSSSIDMEEVKNYVKEQKIRSDLVEYDDDEVADNDLDSTNVPSTLKRKMDKSDTALPKRVRFSLNEKENKEVKINVTASNKTGDVDHTKIISELLKKYPDLMKKKKNIRLKIMAKSNKTQPASEVQQQSVKSTSKVRVALPSSPAKVNLLDEKKKDEGPWLCSRCSTPNEPVEFVLYYLYRKHMTDVHNEKFDSRMCKYCGHKSSKHNMLMYHLYTKHGIKPPLAYNFPKCNQCPYIALTEALLIKHKLNHTKFELQCVECKVAFNSQHSLTSHMQITGHTGKSDKNNYDCQYCTKRYQTGANLFSHIKMQHRAEARRDGIVSIDEIEDIEEMDEGDNENEQSQSSDEYITPDIIHSNRHEKVKIISNLELPVIKQQEVLQQNVTLEPSSEAEALSNVASGIATSLGLVDIVVLDDNHQYILHSKDQQFVTDHDLQNSQTEFIIPDITDSHAFAQNQNINEVITSQHSVITQSMLGNSDIASTDELVMVLTDHDYGDGNNELINNDNSNIVVLYSHPVDGQENQFITSQGNLMVNSQTGMIEIRNGTTIATTTAEQLVVANTQDSHIESIEMIQKEIDSHADTKAEYLQDDKQNVSDANNLESAVHCKTSFAKQYAKKETLNEHVPQVQFNTPDILGSHEDQSESETQSYVQSLPEGTAQPVKEESEEFNQSADDSVVDQNSDDIMEIDESDQVQKQTEGVKEQMVVDAESLPESSVETEHGTMKQSEEIVPIENNENLMEIQENTQQSADTQEAQAYYASEPDEIIQDDYYNSQLKNKSNSDAGIERSENDCSEEIKEKKANENEIPPEEILLNQTDTDDFQEINDIPESENVHTKNEENVYKENENTVSENVIVNKDANKMQEDEQADIVHTDESLHKDESNEQPLESEVNCDNEESYQNVSVESEASKSIEYSQEEEEEQEQDENHPEEEIHEVEGVHQTGDVDQIEDISQEDTQQENNTSFVDDNSQTTNDESSQSSQNLHNSQVATFIKTNIDQSAKTSILDDWEDTDSQQSELPEGKSGNTVNKLIDDWADDEDVEDDTKKSA